MSNAKNPKNYTVKMKGDVEVKLQTHRTYVEVIVIVSMKAFNFNKATEYSAKNKTTVEIQLNRSTELKKSVTLRYKIQVGQINRKSGNYISVGNDQVSGTIRLFPKLYDQALPLDY